MTDKQIIKAMNCCYRSVGECAQCPYFGDILCVSALGKDALSLINSQSARIKILKAENKRLQNLLNDLMKDEVST